MGQRIYRLFWLSCVLVLLKPTASTAQNLLFNGDFDSDTSGWTGISSSTLSWVSDDGAPFSGDGSMMNINSFNNNASFPAISDKFSVMPLYWYTSGASYKIPADSPVPWVWYVIYWYDDMNNQIGISNQVSVEFGVPNDVWEQFSGMSQAPELATQGELRIYFTTGATGEIDLPYGLWDDVYLLEETIFISGFD